jgi:hypothetical protein
MRRGLADNSTFGLSFLQRSYPSYVTAYLAVTHMLTAAPDVSGFQFLFLAIRLRYTR